MKYLALVLGAVMSGFIAMPLLVMLVWPPTAGRSVFGTEILPPLLLGTMVMVRDTALGPQLPRGELVFPVLFVGAGLPLVSSVFPAFLALVFSLDALMATTMLLMLGVELAAAVTDRPGLRWIRLVWCVLVCTSLVALHLFNSATSLWQIVGSWLGGAVVYAGLSLLAGPLPPERILFGKLSKDFRTGCGIVVLGFALAAGALVIFAIWVGDVAIDLPL